MPTDSLEIQVPDPHHHRLAPTDSLGRLIYDGGPVYAETDLSRLIAEPFNTASAFVFVLIAGYWVWRLRHSFLQHRYLSIALGMLIIGGIGGTIYHGFRVSQVFLVMDWLPILLICLTASMYYFRLAAGRWLPAILTIAALFALQYLNFLLFPPSIGVNVSYLMMGLMVLVPTIWLLRKTRFQNGAWVLAALVAFGLALTFRLSDASLGWPMGTHFLWHLFGAVACHSMFMYTFLLREVKEKMATGAYA